MSKKTIFTAARRPLSLPQLRRIRPPTPPRRRLVEVQLADGGERVALPTSEALDLVCHRKATFIE